MELRKNIPLGDNLEEHAVCMGADGRALRGNLILSGSDVNLGALIIHGHGGVRSGPHDMLTKLARALGAQGISSIRFDLSGRGESDGLPEETSLADMAKDSLLAVEYLKKRAGISRVLIIGICSGGNVGIGLLDRMPEVAGLFLLSVYPFGEADSFGRDAQRSFGHMREYWHKLWLGETWKRILKGEVQFRIIAGILLKPLRKTLFRKKIGQEDETSQVHGHPLENLLINRPRLRMVYGDRDPDFDASRKYYTEFTTKNHVATKIHVIPGANHNFYSNKWMEEIENELKSFLKEIKE